MRPYDELTERGKVRRLHGLARTALGAYDLEVSGLRCIARDTNSTFRVDGGDGRRYALRIGTRPEDTEVDTATELAWLAALANEPEIAAAEPVRNRAGELVTRVAQPGVTAIRKCVLFGWLPGDTLGEDATVDDYRLLGELSALLHDHGERWIPPPGLQPLVWDRVFYYPTEPVVLYDERYQELMTPDRTAIVREVEARAAAELERLHREVPVQVLHGDLHPWNVHLDEGRMHVFDFEDVMIGAPVQDIAISLFYNRDRADYADLRAAFEAGYTPLRAWPVESDNQLGLLMAARTVMFINYVLRLDLDAADFVPRAVNRIAPLLSS